VESFWEAEEEESDHHNGSILLQAAITVGDFQLAGLLIECGVVGDFKALDAAIDKQSFQLFHHLLEAQLLNPGPTMKTGKHLDKYYHMLKGHPHVLAKILAEERKILCQLH